MFVFAWVLKLFVVMLMTLSFAYAVGVSLAGLLTWKVSTFSTLHPATEGAWAMILALILLLLSIKAGFLEEDDAIV